MVVLKDRTTELMTDLQPAVFSLFAIFLCWSGEVEQHIWSSKVYKMQNAGPEDLNPDHWLRGRWEPTNRARPANMYAWDRVELSTHELSESIALPTGDYRYINFIHKNYGPTIQNCDSAYKAAGVRWNPPYTMDLIEVCKKLRGEDLNYRPWVKEPNELPADCSIPR